MLNTMSNATPKLWVITDTHFGDDWVVDMCGRPHNHMDRMLKGIRQQVQPQDVLIHLGDVCFGKDAHYHESLRNANPGRQWLLRGNHDRKTTSWYLNAGWSMVCEEFTLEAFNKRIVFSHAPVKDTGFDLNIHGHFHNTDHRRFDPGYNSILCEKHFLLSMEEGNLRPHTLESLIKQWKKSLKT